MLDLDDLKTGVTYQCRVNMQSGRAPTPSLKRADFTWFKSTRKRHGSLADFTIGPKDQGYDGEELPWCFEPIGIKRGPKEVLLGDEIREEEREQSFASHDRAVLLGQLANVIDHANDSHWTESGMARLDFFNDKLPIGQRTTREELKVLFPNLVRNT